MRIMLTRRLFVDITRGARGTVYVQWEAWRIGGLILYSGPHWFVARGKFGETYWIHVGPLGFAFIVNGDDPPTERAR